VLNEHRQQLQCVALGARRAAGRLIHVVELGPRPTGLRLRLDDSPLSFRSIDTGSKTSAVLPFSRAASAPGGQPSHITRTGYMRSTGNPSAQNSRVAATSAYTPPFSHPNFTFISSSGGIAQVNFGERPVISLLTYLQVDRLARRKRAMPLGTDPQIHRRNVDRLPYLRAADGVEPRRW
jgi:hypothetical protein